MTNVFDRNKSCAIFVGIDVSKEKFDVCCIDSNGKKQFQLSASMNEFGFNELNKNLSSISGSKSSILIAMESTACYHINLYSFLTNMDYNVIIVNPLLVSNFVKLQLRKTKTDKKDAFVIARFLLINKGTLSQSLISPDISDLRDLARQRESLIAQMTAIKNDIKRILSIIFPELETIVGIFTKSMLQMLLQFPSAHAVKSATATDLSNIIIPSSRGRKTSTSADKIIETAKSSIGTASPTKDIIVRQKVSILINLKGHLQEITTLIIKLCESTMEKDLEILKSIKGIGDTTATNFLIEMGGDINNFETHKQLIAMSGLDPSVYQSGKFEGQSSITKRGNKHLRRVIWLMATKVIIYNDLFKAYYKKRRKDGLPYKKAVLATAHKLIRVMFAMLSHKTHFIVNEKCI